MQSYLNIYEEMYCKGKGSGQIIQSFQGNATLSRGESGSGGVFMQEAEIYFATNGNKVE